MKIFENFLSQDFSWDLFMEICKREGAVYNMTVKEAMNKNDCNKG